MSKKRMAFLKRIKASNRGFGGKGAQPLSPELDLNVRLDRDVVKIGITGRFYLKNWSSSIIPFLLCIMLDDTERW